MNEIQFERGMPVDAYGGGGFRVGGEFHAGSALIAPGGVRSWPVGAVSEITAEAVQPLIDLADEIDFVIFGMGPEIAVCPAPVRELLEGASIGVEVMATPAACRTYNVLLAEDRRLAAGLIAM